VTDKGKTLAKQISANNSDFYKNQRDEITNNNNRICTKCNTSKTLDNFRKYAKPREGHRSICKKCESNVGVLKANHDRLNNIKYTCDICDKSYANKGNLTRHKKVINAINCIHEQCRKVLWV
jgi:hypothetical protein